nr:5'-3' exonuclease H3TH domain-containing protein [Oscillospiraceae bacterium]
MKLLAVDSNSIMNRAFYGIKLLTTRSGFYTNAVYGFLNIFLATISEVHPDAVVFAFDMHGPTFRHNLYDAYKSGRHKPPDELSAQFPLIKELLRDLGYPILESPGFEADDILGTLADACEKAGWDCVISTGDRDSLQLVTDHVSVRLASTKMGSPVSTLMGPEEIFKTYGVHPKQLIEVKALMGDPSDNIPGVPGVGEKTALDLIAKYGSVDYVYDHLNELGLKPGVLKKLEEGKESAYLSRTLGTVSKDAPVPLDPAVYLRGEPDEAAACSLLAKLEMYKMPQKLGLDPSKVPKKPLEHEEEEVPIQLSAADVTALADCGTWERAYLLPEAEGDDITAAAFSDGEKIYLVENSGLFFESAFSGFLASDCPKLCDDLKFLCRWADARKADVRRCVMDTGLAGYILNVTGDDYSPEKLSALYGAEKREIAGDSSGHEDLIRRMASFPSLCQKLQREIDRNNQNSLLNDIELPLAKVLADMELCGFEIDPEGLRAYGDELSESIKVTEQQVYELAGETFNILSPKQLGKV